MVTYLGNDISKCSGEGCPLKERCYRFNTPMSEYRQTIFVNPPYDKKTKKCDEYWKDINYREKKGAKKCK